MMVGAFLYLPDRYQGESVSKGLLALERMVSTG